MELGRSSSSCGRKRFMHSVCVADGGWDLCEVDLRNVQRGVSFPFDCHVHTVASDGERSPGHLALEVFSGGRTVVVADHFSLLGAELAAGELRSVFEGVGFSGDCGIVGGVELSARVELPSLRQVRKLHILGLGVDVGDRRLREWLSNYRRLRGSDIEYALEVKGDLESRGFRFDDRVLWRLQSKRNVYQVLVESIFSCPSNWRLIDGHFGLKVHHIASRRKRRLKNAQMRRRMVRTLRREYGDFTASKPSLEDVVSLVRGAGGLAVVAHPVASIPQLPYFSVRKMTEVFYALAELGIDGVEAYTPSHGLEVADCIAKAALDAGLLVLGGSDAHRLSDELGVFVSERFAAPRPF